MAALSMLKKRVIILLTLANGKLMRTKNFRADRWYSLNFIDLGGFDEAVCINLTPEDPETFAATVGKLSDEAMVPITVGGGIASVDDVRRVFDTMPAEKVVVETHAGEWMDGAAAKFGRQALVYGMTVDRDSTMRPPEGSYGEIMFQDVKRDGSLEGYFMGFMDDELDVPIVIGSGCGTVQHMIDAFNAGADGCATSCIFHFTPNAVAGMKAKLQEAGIPVRI